MRSKPMLALWLACASAASAQVPPDGAPVLDLQTFQAALGPYGEWVAVSPYEEAWRPAGVDSGWRPYFDGYWTWTDDGWFWVSDEPWGWATYHYGRWFYDGTFGWVWVPGYDWAPAWVAWRYGDGYVGWAPLYPGAVIWWEDYPVPITYWCFVPVVRFVGVPVQTIYVPSPTVREIFHRTRPAPPPVQRTGLAPRFGGPLRSAIEAVVGRPLPPARVVAAPTPEAARGRPHQGAIPAYRPRGVAPSPASASAGGPAPAPRAEPPAPARRAPPAPQRTAPHGDEDRSLR
ncbi:MAG TPA: DUF6600 domain-containing protein [Anaeromyxobacteraceae bacterium]|nr:DUF6600 domain-containing protein [Anaeromyxobacteraceae bacterium]